MEARAMNNLVSINSKKVLGAYMDAQNSELITEGTYFYMGVLLSVVLPQFVLSVYGGFLPLIELALSAVVGSSIGLARYYWFPYRLLSCVNKRAEARIPPRINTSRKKAA
jgi:hypothetical protein